MKMFTECSGECCVCACGGGCLAGHGDDDFSPATKEQIIERLDKGQYKDDTEYMKVYLKSKYNHDYDCKKSISEKYKPIRNVKLNPLPDYQIDRGVFCEIVKNTVGHDRLLDAFDCSVFNQSDEFVWFRHENSYYIIHLESGMMVGWYKNLGRCNVCSQNNRTVEDYYQFFYKFTEDLEYWEEMNNMEYSETCGYDNGVYF